MGWLVAILVVLAVVYPPIIGLYILWGLGFIYCKLMENVGGERLE